MTDWIHTRNGQMLLSLLRQLVEAVQELAHELKRHNDQGGGQE